METESFRIAEELAAQTYEVFKGRWGHYNNTVNSHLRGKVGEIGCHLWLDAQGIPHELVYENLARLEEADIILNAGRPFRFDVKTWDTRYWKAMGRCVAFKQLPKLKKKANAVLWCVTPKELAPGVEVEIFGWSSIRDIENSPRRMTGPAHRRQVDNYQVDLEAIRPLPEIHEALKAIDRRYA